MKVLKLMKMISQVTAFLLWINSLDCWDDRQIVFRDVPRQEGEDWLQIGHRLSTRPLQL